MCLIDQNPLAYQEIVASQLKVWVHIPVAQKIVSFRYSTLKKLSKATEEDNAAIRDKFN